MKTLLVTSIILFSHFCYAQEFVVKFDTIEIEIAGSTKEWIRHKDFIFAYYNTRNPYSSAGDRHFYVIDSKGKILKEVEVPEELQKTYIDLYVRNDSIFTTEYWKQNTYYLDLEHFKWIKTKKADDLIYEDDDYYVTSLDFGEWGGSTWFIDKNTSDQFEVGVTTPIINRFKGNYIIKAGRSVYAVSDPHNLEKSDSPYDYDQVVGNLIGDGSFHEPSNSMKGLDTIFQDTTSPWESGFYIATSFIQNNNLYFLCIDSNELYVGEIYDGAMKKVYQFPDTLSPLRWYYHYRNRIQNNRYQSLQFTTKDKHIQGIFLFDGDQTKVTYVKNNYRISILGSSASTAWFEDNFSFYFKKLDSLYLVTIDSIEINSQAVDVTPRHKISTSLKPELELESPRCYQKIEDSLIVMETMYYFTAADNKIEIVSFKWKTNNLFETDHRFIPDDQNEAYIALAEKLENIKNFLSKQFGEPTSDRKESNWMSTKWKIDNYSIILHSNKPMNKNNLVTKIELTFYKN